MPPVRTTKGSAKPNAQPYPSSKPDDAAAAVSNDKENEAPRDSASPTNDSAKLKEPTQNKSTTKSTSKGISTKASAHLPDSYLDIVLEEKKGEVPCYENASAIRRRLNILLEKKTHIPGTTKPFNKTALAKELSEIAHRHHPIETTAGFRAEGPSVRALTAFLKKTGGMGGGDSESYYYGNMLLEKMRIWRGEKKSKAREKAEQEFPDGRYRTDPAHFSILCRPGEQPTWGEVAQMKR